MTQTDTHAYEVLLCERLVRLYLDWPSSAMDTMAVVDKVVSKLREFAGDDLASALARVVTLTGSVPNKKNSFHLVFPDMIFRSINDDRKTFMRSFVQWLGAADLLTYVKNETRHSVVDLVVYSKCRSFRMLGQSKSTRPQWRHRLTDAGDVPLSDTLVQPPYVRLVPRMKR